MDIAVIAKLDIPADTPSAAVLDGLFDVIKGVPGSIYHGKVAHNSRCVTVE